MARPNIFPALRYRDANAAIEWLGRAFGFQEKVVHRGEHSEVNHAELALGTGIVMLGQARPAGWLGGGASDARASTMSVYVVVADPDAHHERARAAGAEIVRELTDEDYGSREYSARDPEGNLWSFGTYDPCDEGRAS
ncbi:MAG TPA: VOC family protein [Solirubrobacteraceae bacterium]|nr:VOC family protein [Solirubrobacteraceae bacterium]